MQVRRPAQIPDDAARKWEKREYE